MGNIQTIENLLFKILDYSFLLPFLAFIIFFGKLKSKTIAIVIASYSLFFFILLFNDEFLSIYYRHIYSTVYTTAEYLTFAFIIYLLLQKRKSKLLLGAFSTLFIIFQGTNYFLSNYHVLDSIPIGIETILIIFFIFILFYEQFQMAETISIYNHYWFWFVMGILFYLSSTFFFNILANSERSTAEKYWFLTYMFETVKNILFTVGMMVYVKQLKEKNKIRYLPNLDFN